MPKFKCLTPETNNKYRHLNKKIQEGFFLCKKYHQNRFFEKNGHNFLNKGWNALALSIRSVFWVDLGGSVFLTFFDLVQYFFRKQLFQFLVVSTFWTHFFKNAIKNFWNEKCSFFFKLIVKPNQESQKNLYTYK